MLDQLVVRSSVRSASAITKPGIDATTDSHFSFLNMSHISFSMVVSFASTFQIRTASRGKTTIFACNHGLRLQRLERVPLSQHIVAARPYSRSDTGCKWHVTHVATRAQCKDDLAYPEMEESVPVVFSVSAALEFGVSLKICGSCSSLGSWDLEAAPSMTWTEGDLWVLETRLPTLPVEVKCVAVSENIDFVQWEPGENRVLQVPGTLEKDETVRVSLQYGRTGATDISIQSEVSSSEATPGEPALSAPSTKEHTKSEGIPNGTSDMKQPLREGLESEADSTQLSAAVRMLREEPATDAAALSQRSADAPMENGLVDECAELDDTQAASRAKGDAASEAKGEMTDPARAAKEFTGGDTEAKSRQTADAETSEIQKPDDNLQDEKKKDFDSLSERNENGLKKGSMNAFISGLGVMCLPVVVWSELTLYQTGCGLPPGPAGLLGAAEGISYLVVPGFLFWSIFQRLRSKSTGVPLVLEVSSLLAVCAGIFVLASQVATYGYIPSALPDQNCPTQPTSIAELFKLV